MRKKKGKCLSILFGLTLLVLALVNLGLPGPALSAANQETPQPSAPTKVKKLTLDDLALYIHENGTSDIHVRNANQGYQYALLDSNGNAISGWKDPKDGRVIFEGQESGKDYSVVFSPDDWTEGIDPGQWSGTAIHFNLPDFDDAIDKTFVNPQDVERSKDGTTIWIYSTHRECEYALYEFYSDQKMTEWKDGVAGVVVFTGLKPYLNYNVRARIKGTGPKPEIIPDKTLPMPGADVIVAECSFDDLSGYGLIHVWASPGYGYAILGADGNPLSNQEMLKWNVFVKDQYDHEIYPDDDQYYRSKNGGRITFSVPAGGTYKMGGKQPDGTVFVDNQKFQVKSVNKNYWYEYIIPQGKQREDGFYRLVISPACPEVVYKLSAIHSFIHFIDRYASVKPGGDNRVIFSPVNSFLDYVITAQPIPLTLTESPEEDLFGDDLWNSAVWGSGAPDVSVSGGDAPDVSVSGGDAPDVSVSGGDAFVQIPSLQGEFEALTDQDVTRSEDGKTITVTGSADQQYTLVDPITNVPLSEWHYAENGQVVFHSLDPALPYLILTQIPETETTVCVFQPQGVYVPGVVPGGGHVSGGDAGGADGERTAVHLTVQMFQSINGSDPSILDQTVQFGDSVLYSLVVENCGDRDTSDVVITDKIPDGMTLKEGSISGGGVYNADTRTITWKINLDRPGAENGSGMVSLQFQVTVDRNQRKTSYSNLAYVEQKGASIDASNTVHASTAVITVAKKAYDSRKDSKTPFLFTLRLCPTQGHEIDTDKIVCPDESAVFVKEGQYYVARFALVDRQQVQFIGLPAGIVYQVEENSANLDDYKTTVTDVTGRVLTDQWGQCGGAGTIPSDGTDIAVLFLNERTDLSARSEAVE